MFDIVFQLVGSIAAFIFPVFASYKAIKTSNAAAIHFWLMYWVVIGCLSVVEAWVGFILNWVPFYQNIRAMFLLWLVLPQFQGATKLYTEYIHPTLEQHEMEIESFITKTHDEAKALGDDYVKRLVAYFQQQITGEREERENAVKPDPALAGVTFAQRLLSQFQTPSTAPIPRPPSQTTQTTQSLLDMFTSGLAQRVPGNPLASFLNANVDAEVGKVRIIQTRNELRNALEILDAQLAMLNTSEEKPRDAVALPKSSSDQDFEHVEKSDLLPAKADTGNKTTPVQQQQSWWGWASGSQPAVKAKSD